VEPPVLEVLDVLEPPVLDVLEPPVLDVLEPPVLDVLEPPELLETSVSRSERSTAIPPQPGATNAAAITV
jgi:hypothetical protein